jgi:hypothetical protein
VRGDRVRAYWGAERARAGEVVLSAAAAQADEEFRSFTKRHDGVAASRERAWFPGRGGVGLYVYRGTASFRRVTLEPLTEAAGAAGGNN